VVTNLKGSRYGKQKLNLTNILAFNQKPLTKSTRITPQNNTIFTSLCPCYHWTSSINLMLLQKFFSLLKFSLSCAPLLNHLHPFAFWVLIWISMGTPGLARPSGGSEVWSNRPRTHRTSWSQSWSKEHQITPSHRWVHSHYWRRRRHLLHPSWETSRFKYSNNKHNYRQWEFPNF